MIEHITGLSRTSLLTREHRRILRQLSLRKLEDGYLELLHGDSESLVCRMLGIDTAKFEGILQSSIREALWERGYFSARHQLSV